jgi:hypothetical protein
MIHNKSISSAYILIYEIRDRRGSECSIIRQKMAVYRVQLQSNDSIVTYTVNAVVKELFKIRIQTLPAQKKDRYI